MKKKQNGRIKIFGGSNWTLNALKQLMNGQKK